MSYVRVAVCLVVIYGLTKGTVLRSRQDHPRAPWMKVSYCSPDHEDKFHEAALEARQVIQAAGERLRGLSQYDEKNPIPRLHDLDPQLQSIVRTYSCMIDGFLPGVLGVQTSEPTIQYTDDNDDDDDDDDEPLDSPDHVYTRLARFIESINDKLLPVMNSDVEQERIEITCGYSWLSRRVPRARLLPPEDQGNVDQYFDDRASIEPDPTDPENGRWHEIADFHAFTGPNLRGLEARLFTEWSGPLEDVLAVSGFPWPKHFTDARTGLETEVTSLQQIKTEQYYPGTWELQDIFEKSLTSFLIRFFCQMPSLAESTYHPLRTAGGLVSEDGNWDDITTLAALDPESAYISAENFTYLVLAMYLNNMEWTSGVNSGPVQQE